ncbi:hypothetical protein PHMEG_0005168 [Phytophthora megakarya]|uniref:Uncharacterized protein n=1 Tax=Phytophthora megakarya TaxID=4795 RepID=A0A225WS45_9STRA|nr:hypothetical protein PHMEG_0005168 [Phytophthora megakarya]
MSARIAESCYEYVSTNAYAYNFVVPRGLVIQLTAVTENKMQKRQATKYFKTEQDAGHYQ